MIFTRSHIRLNTDINPSKTRKELIKRIEFQVQSKKFVICPALNRRKVFLIKFLEVNQRARANINRLQSFNCALEVIAEAKTFKMTGKYKHSYEMRGLTYDNKLVVVHVRDELFTRKNWKLFLVSCYWKQK